ncbi:alkane hydroxylase MAH1-like [Durio zibethinus]|uniref:Alkane hydroxylase MAH1-like n=1 Tax=Durio zibethinus TaxID=66656 RepID=A0A6P5ZC49_DURZI|nr:alkane hydroxylase MAH1-like [Durio zibethinus]
MLPVLLTNFHRLHDITVEILESSGGTFIVKGAWFTNLDLMITRDPGNVHHITSTNFGIYPKGMGWKNRLDIFGNTLFNSDFDDANSFPVSFHETLLSNAISNACKAILDRHILPDSFWKLQKWLGIGKEGKLGDVWTTVDNVLAEQVSLKRKEMSNRMEDEDVDFNALGLHLIGHELLRTVSASNNVIRDNMSGLMFSSQDTTSTVLSWSFWLLLKHPVVEKRIQEIQQYFPQNVEMKWLAFGAKELNKLVYLPAALCETLRLLPPVPFEIRTHVKNDTLPNGRRINQGKNILICTHAMGRMTSVWGDDCHELQPERWITHGGGIKHEWPHKFFAFNAGPRICLGKEIAFTLMKMIASGFIHNYHIQVVENNPLNP